MDYTVRVMALSISYAMLQLRRGEVSTLLADPLTALWTIIPLMEIHSQTLCSISLKVKQRKAEDFTWR